MFGDLLPNDNHVLGKSDLNDMLEKFKRVARNILWRYYQPSFDVAQIMFNEIVDRDAKQSVEKEIWEKRVKDAAEGVFVETPQFDQAYYNLEKHGVCVLVGPPGYGKSLMADMLAFKRRINGYNINICTDIENIRLRRAENDEKWLYVFDDFMGEFQNKALNMSGLCAGLQYIHDLSQSGETGYAQILITIG